jgi:RNA polymerase sigma-70 factor (ECF subfamily)
MAVIATGLADIRTSSAAFQRCERGTTGREAALHYFATAVTRVASNFSRWKTRVSHDEDRENVRAVLAGDDSAFGRIVERWQRPLVSLAYRFVRDRGRAEDLAQDAFLRAYRTLASWRQDSAFSTWLFALALNLFRSELRRIPPRMVSIDDVGELAGRSEPWEFEQSDRARVVRAAVLALPTKYRETMVVYYFHRSEVAATAMTLGIPEGTVKARLHRGRELLRRKLTA